MGLTIARGAGGAADRDRERERSLARLDELFRPHESDSGMMEIKRAARAFLERHDNPRRSDPDPS